MNVEFAKTTSEKERNEIIKYYSNPKKKKSKKTKKYKERKKRYNQKKANINAVKLTKKVTKAEKILKTIFNEDGIIYQFQRIFWNEKHCYIVDFFFKNVNGVKYVIEVDGPSHNTKRQKEYDKKRTAFLKHKRNCHVIRYKNKDVFNNTEKVISEIYRLMPKSIKLLK